jgi:hypothetical protein
MQLIIYGLSTQMKETPPLPRSSCATPVLLIRSTAGNLTWFAAGIQKF